MANGKAIDLMNSFGSNTNGYYNKLSDGTLLQWGSTTMTAPTDTSAGGGTYHYSGEKNITFPIEFTSTPYVFANANELGAWWNAQARNPSTTGVTLGIGGNNSTASKTVYWLAIGRWK